MKRRSAIVSIFLLLVLVGCNLPLGQKNSNPTITVVATMAPLTGAGVRILSPVDGTQLAAGSAVQVNFESSGGPFIEAVLLVDGTVTTSLPLDASNPAPGGTLSWTPQTNGTHTLTVEVLTPTKDSYTASITVSVSGGTAPSATNLPISTTAAPTADPARAAILTKALQIFQDTYHLTVTAPPLARKYRQGVEDPWISVVYVKNWMYALYLYPDRVEQQVSPINMQDDGSVPIPVGEKAIPVCRPAGTLKILVALVDYQNLGVTKEQEIAAVQTATAAINQRFSGYSTAVGASSPILQLDVTPVFISPAPHMKDDLITPAQVKSLTGVDPAPYDLLVQMDLDSNNTRRKVNASEKFDTNGFEIEACPEKGLSIWMGLDTLDQALDRDSDRTMESIFSHELLHTFGYPASHLWPGGDGTVIDRADEADSTNWPTLMLGWTDTDGDGIPEILDATPYGSNQ